MVLSPMLLQATTYTLEPVADARVISLSGGFDTMNYAADILSVYTSISGGNTQRTFMTFNLSSVSLASTQRVDSAVLTLHASTAFGGNPAKPMEIFRVTAPWTESGLTWSNRDATHPWAAAGGDFTGLNGQPYSVSTNSPVEGQAVAWDITELVDEWVAQGVVNNGLVLRSYDGNGLTFSQRESANTTLRPKLTIVVSTGPPRLHAAFDGSTHQVLLSWSGVGIAVLQEKTNLNPAIIWSDSSLTVTPSNGVSYVHIAVPAGNRYFRLRGTP
jgi:hypothetical protein